MAFIDWLLLALVAAMAAAALVYTIKNRKKGCCGGECGTCPYGEGCRKAQKKEEEKDK